WHNRAWIHMPDLRRVFSYGSIRRKLSCPSHIQDSLPDPSTAVSVCRVNTVLRVDVSPQIRQQHVMISVRQQRLSQGPEDSRLHHAEKIIFDEFDCPTDLLVAVID